jgi:probable F420-dependent oxidoreductase
MRGHNDIGLRYCSGARARALAERRALPSLISSADINAEHLRESVLHRPSVRPFRFGVGCSEATSRSAWVDVAKRAESLGFDVLAISDHFRPQLAPFAALAVAAASTTHLRLATHMIDNDFRHPAVLAKEAATLDLLSDGRFELGLGAGWDRSDYEQSGIAFDAPTVRVERLEESVRIIRALFADGPVTFEGTHYRIAALEGQPKPAQRPGPPIHIGGGRKRVLSIAARHADIVGVHVVLGDEGMRRNDGATLTDAAVAERVRWIRAAAAERWSALELQVLVYLVALDRPRDEVAADAHARLGIGDDEVSSSPHVLAGSLDEIVERLLERRERFGLSYVTTNWPNRDAMAKVVARLKGR